MKKPKAFYFVVGVSKASSKKAAELAVLSAFAKRNPDGCEFHLRPHDKREWMAGAKAGFDTAVAAVESLTANLKKMNLKP